LTLQGLPPDLINELDCEKIDTGPDITSSDTDVFHLSHLSDSHRTDLENLSFSYKSAFNDNPGKNISHVTQN
jgi:hypothetical protein